MGDRISIRFKHKFSSESSPYFFSHWDGLHLLEIVKEYLESIREFVEDGNTLPLQRLEPQTLLVDFIRYIVTEYKWDMIVNNYYLESSEEKGDNSDNGNYDIVVWKERDKMKYEIDGISE